MIRSERSVNFSLLIFVVSQKKRTFALIFNRIICIALSDL